MVFTDFVKKPDFLQRNRLINDKWLIGKEFAKTGNSEKVNKLLQTKHLSYLYN